jgi:uncharacterized membrane protein
LTTILPVHILGGFFALLFGYVALSVAKGGKIHRKSGLGFVIAMLVMAATGALIAVIEADRGSIVAGSLTFYFVTTGFLAVKRIPGARTIEAVAMCAAVVLSGFAIWAGTWLAGRGRPEAVPMFIFATLSIVAAIGDWKMLRAGGIQGKPRIKRHLWRLCFAMWVAAASFFWGPPNRVPEMIRIPALLPIPVLAPVAVMLYWLWRMRGNRPPRGINTVVPLDHTVRVSL